MFCRSFRSASLDFSALAERRLINCTVMAENRHDMECCDMYRAPKWRITSLQTLVIASAALVAGLAEVETGGEIARAAGGKLARDSGGNDFGELDELENVQGLLAIALAFEISGADVFNIAVFFVDQEGFAHVRGRLSISHLTTISIVRNTGMIGPS